MLKKTYIVKMTRIYLLVLLCILKCTAQEVENEPLRHRAKTNQLTVDMVAANHTVVSVESLTMDMKHRIVHTFQIQIVCFVQNERKCIDISVSDPTESVIAIEVPPNVCFTCNAFDTSTENMKAVTNDSRDAVGAFLQEARVNITIESLLIGVANIKFTASNQSGIISNTYSADYVEIEVKVVRQPNILDIIFNICIYCVEVFEMFVFGTQLDFGQLKKTFRTPVLPLVGFLCQYIGMPLISFSIAKFSSSQPLAALGIFVAGICPGGGGSNIYTYLLGGDLSLSITMTTISTVLSLGMMPLWLYTLGGEFLEDGATQATIPYTDILITLSIILVPLAVGILIHHRYPRAANVIEKVLTVVITVVALVLIVIGVYSYLYVFQLMSLKVVLIGCALPYIGIFLGGIVSILLGLSADVVKTIAIETGLQNSAVGYILLTNSLSPPYGDIACVAPISAELISPIPPFVTAIVYLIYKKRAKNYDEVPHHFVQDLSLNTDKSDYNQQNIPNTPNGKRVSSNSISMDEENSISQRKTSTDNET